MRKKAFYGLLAITAVLLLILGRQHLIPESGGEVRSAPDSQQTGWSFCSAIKGPITDTISLSGKIEPFITRSVVSCVEARIKEVLVKPGDYVKEGQILIRLNEEDLINEIERARVVYLEAKSTLQDLRNWKSSPSYQSASYRYQNAQSEYEEARKRYEEDQDLYAQKAISKSDLHQSYLTLQRSGISLETARADLAEQESQADEFAMKKAESEFAVAERELEDRKRALAHKLVTAPCAGILTQPSAGQTGTAEREMALAENRRLSAGEVLFKIEDHSRFAVVARLSEHDVFRVKVGQQGKIAVPALPGAYFSGAIDAIEAAGDGNGNDYYQVRCPLDQGSEQLKPGLSAHLDIVVASRADALLVPAAALCRKNGVFGVFVSGEKGPVFMPVQIGLKTLAMAEIVAGLQPGQQIVCRIPADLLNQPATANGIPQGLPGKMPAQPSGPPHGLPSGLPEGLPKNLPQGAVPPPAVVRN